MGDYKLGKPYWNHGIGGIDWYRDDVWVSPKTPHSDGNINRFSVADANDMSPGVVNVHGHELYMYDERCACCYLGHAHSVNYHNKSVIEHDQNNNPKGVSHA